MKTSHEIRETFLRFFEERNHRRVKSSPIVPKDDPTLLFTNAGMNQFKDVFLGREKRDYQRATTSQKCMRVSGKHNDLETVGRTPRHHTFFEMLGNFSFGDYFKEEATRFAWELCTEVYGLDPERLIVTVFEEDDEALEIWRDEVGVEADRILKCGAKENFWAMGETGPCGPCSELHFDMGDWIGDTESPFGAESDRFVEIWNLVFMQYNRDAQGNLTPLPRPSIDTGMGLERITCILQEVTSNYETDLFAPIIDEAETLLGVDYGENEERDVSLRILADHSRAAMFLVNDGVIPGNEGRGYVLRKILRRAIRHGQLLGSGKPFLYTLTSLVGDLMRDAYPELENTREYAAKVVRNEEEKFSATLSHGLSLLEDLFTEVKKDDSSEIPGDELFRLYDTYGFPFDLACEIAEERGFDVDREGFEAELEKQRQRARASWKGSEARVNPAYRKLADEDLDTEFTGYETIRDVTGEVLALLRDGERVDSLAEGEEGEVILSRTPFYAEAGGQVGDRGTIETETATARVHDAYRPVTGVHLHRVEVLHGTFSLGEKVRSSVDQERRDAILNNHTATHLLHAALREVVGDHVKQSGSLVAPDRLRFDFNHYKSLSNWEIRQIEERVNERIRANIGVETEIRSLEEAMDAGAMALFGEKYADRVRVVRVPGVSMELCGGTHVDRTGDISLFKIVSEGSISAGVRRVEAITGRTAVARFLEDEEKLEEIKKDLNVNRDQLTEAVQRILRDLKNAQKEVEELKLKLARSSSRDPEAEAREVAGVQVLARKVENLDRNGLRQLADQLRNKISPGVVVLGAPVNGKVSLVVMVSEELTDRIRADKLIQPIARLVKGGGGGKPEMAEAGGKDAGALDEALTSVYDLVAEQLK